MKKLKNKNMPDPIPSYAAEVWTGETFMQGFNGTTALCDAVQYSFMQSVQNTEVEIYYLNGTDWLQWVGPRPVNPPGR